MPPTTPAVFDDEDAMMKQMKAMGMPEHMLRSLTPAQKKKMFEMTKQRDIVERAQKLVSSEKQTSELKQCENYAWRDASDHVYLEIRCGKERTAKDIVCKLEENSIHVSVASDSEPILILEGSLFQSIIPQESGWNFQENGILEVKIQKAVHMRWLMVVR